MSDGLSNDREMIHDEISNMVEFLGDIHHNGIYFECLSLLVPCIHRGSGNIHRDIKWCEWYVRIGLHGVGDIGFLLGREDVGIVGPCCCDFGHQGVSEGGDVGKNRVFFEYKSKSGPVNSVTESSIMESHECVRFFEFVEGPFLKNLKG